MENLLEFVMPVYGKPIELIKENLQSFRNSNITGVNIVIVFKNDEHYNYDNLLSFKSRNIRFIEVDKLAKKTQKIKIGIKTSISKFIMPIDCHHGIDFNKLRKVIKMMKKNIDVDIFWTNFLWLDESGSTLKWPWKTKIANAGTQIIKKEILDLELINYDLIYGDDLTWGLLAMIKPNLIYKNVKSKFYLRKISKYSGTYNKSFDEDMIESYKKILNFFLDIIIDHDQYLSTEVKDSIFWIYWYISKRVSSSNNIDLRKSSSEYKKLLVFEILNNDLNKINLFINISKSRRNLFNYLRFYSINNIKY